MTIIIICLVKKHFYNKKYIFFLAVNKHTCNASLVGGCEISGRPLMTRTFSRKPCRTPLAAVPATPILDGKYAKNI